MVDETIVVIKAFSSGLERNVGDNPLETKEVKTPAEFDAAVEDFYYRGLYVEYYGKSGQPRYDKKHFGLFTRNFLFYKKRRLALSL